MITDLASSMYMTGEVILGLSVAVFVGAVIATVENTYLSGRES